jgi:hypothetical protein
MGIFSRLLALQMAYGDMWKQPSQGGMPLLERVRIAYLCRRDGPEPSVATSRQEGISEQHYFMTVNCHPLQNPYNRRLIFGVVTPYN